MGSCFTCAAHEHQNGEVLICASLAGFQLWRSRAPVEGRSSPPEADALPLCCFATAGYHCGSFQGMFFWVISARPGCRRTSLGLIDRNGEPRLKHVWQLPPVIKCGWKCVGCGQAVFWVFWTPARLSRNRNFYDPQLE